MQAKCAIGAYGWKSARQGWHLLFIMLLGGLVLSHLARLMPVAAGAEATPAEITLQVGESKNIAAEAAKLVPAGQSIRYESGNAGFFTVDASGTIKGVHEGSSALAVIAADGTRVEIPVTVKAAASASPAQATSSSERPMEGIVIANAGGQLRVGDVERIIAHVLPHQVIGSNPFTISSSNPAVIRVIEHARVIEAVGEGEATVTATTPDGKHSATVTYTVVARPVESHPEEKTYRLEPERFGIRFDDPSEEAAKANSAGIYQALLHTADNGFTRLLMPEKQVIYIEPRDTIFMVSNVQLDLNGSELRLRPNDYPRYGAIVFREKEGRNRVLENASIVNGIITGERDEKEKYFPDWAKNPQTEGAVSIAFEEGRNNGIRNLTVRKSIGFNIASGIGSRSYGVVHYAQNAISVRNLEEGDYDDQGNAVEATAKIRTVKPIDISKITTPYYTIGYPLGYMGYPYMNSRIYDIWFYDKDMNLLGAARGRLRFRQYELPQGTQFVHVSFYHEGVPAKGNSDFHDAVAFVDNFAMPINNYIIDCVIEDNYSTGLAACGGQGWLIKGNVFRRNGGRMPGCDIDWEDGWEYMQGDLIENNTFESRLNVVVCAGIGLVFRNNTFRGESIFYGRAQHYSMVGNLFEKLEGENAQSVKVAYGSQSDIYVVGNTYRGAAVKYARQHNKEPFIGTYEAHFVNETFDQSQMLQGHVSRMVNCTFSRGPNAALIQADVFEGCTFDEGSYTAAGTIINSNLKNLEFRVLQNQQLTVRDSTLHNPNFTASAAVKGLVIENCRITVDHDKPLVTPNNMDEVIVRNCQIAVGGQAREWALFGGWNAAGANARVLVDTVRLQIPAHVPVYLHKYAWYPPADDERKIKYVIRNSDVSKLRRTDERGEKSNAVFELAGR